MSLHVPERYRVTYGAYGSDATDGNNGAFFVPNKLGKASDRGTPLKIICSDGVNVPEEALHLAGWEHVSVSLPARCPTWAEMSFVKAIFWDGEDCVVQFHPPESEYVNQHPYCLHMWRKIDGAFPLPPSILVGFKAGGVIA